MENICKIPLSETRNYKLSFLCSLLLNTFMLMSNGLRCKRLEGNEEGRIRLEGRIMLKGYTCIYPFMLNH